MDQIAKTGWQHELAAFVIEAEKRDKLIRCFYQNLIFTPKGLAKCLIEGRFRWGLRNWEMVEKDSVKQIDFPDPVQEERSASDVLRIE